MVEVLVAVTILSIGLLGCLSLVGMARDTSDKGDYYGIAARAAAGRIERLRGLALQQDGFVALAAEPVSSPYAVSGLPGGSMTVTVDSLDGNPANADIKEITVTVSWNSKSPGQSSAAGRFTQNTLISDRK